MKRLMYLIVSLILLFFPTIAHADDGWVIDHFNSNISIQRAGEVEILEKIDVDFNTLSKHGIYRDIPYVYESDGKKAYTELAINSVMQNGHKAKYQVSMTDGYIRLKIGDPDRTISGKNSYEIFYNAKGILRGFPDHDELYWNVTGNNWPVGINKADAVVSLPSEGIKMAKCYQGYTGSQGTCSSVVSSPVSARFSSVGGLSENQGITIVAGYEKNMVPLITVKKPKTFWEKFVDWPSLTTLGIGTVFGIGTALYFWIKKGRDNWFANNSGSSSDIGSVKPIGAHETTVVEFTPPEDLRPAEIGVLMDETADTLDVVSTLIDLATRGFLIINEVDKKWLFGKTDYILKSKSKNMEGLRTYEKMLLNKIFADGDEVSISSLKKSFYTDLKQIKDELYKEVVARNLFFENPDLVRGRYLGMSIFMIFIGGFSIAYTVGWGQVFLSDLALGLVVSGIVLLALSRFMPRRTAYGREMYRRIKGYKLFIGQAETYRQRFFEKKNLFNEVLPYAIVFGLTGKFATAMKDIGIKAPVTGWYTGAHPFSTGSFGSSMNDFSSSMSSAIASAPSSGGGFSSSGSSGGGFGGGGGGSW